MLRPRRIALLKTRLIVSERLLTGSIRLRVNLEKRLTLISSVSLRLVATVVSGTAMACRLGGSEREPMLVPGVVLAKQ
jgi:hypothetical protein